MSFSRTVLDGELTDVAGKVLSLTEPLSSDQVRALLAYVGSKTCPLPAAQGEGALCATPASRELGLARSDGETRRLLSLTLLTSAMAGGLVVLALELWVKEAKEGLVLFVLFMAVVFYVIAEAAFGERLVIRAKRCAEEADRRPAG